MKKQILAEELVCRLKRTGVDPKFETLRNGDNRSSQGFGWGFS
jgi:hypothetical protein